MLSLGPSKGNTFLGVLFLPNPLTISSAKRVLSEMSIPSMEVVWFGEITSLNTFPILTQEMNLKSEISSAMGAILGISVINVWLVDLRMVFPLKN